MQNSTIKKLDTAPDHSDTRMARMKNRIKIIVTSALLLAATNAMADINFLPVGGHNYEWKLTDVVISSLSDETFRISTNGLTGELTIQGSDFPPEYGVPASAEGILTFVQQLELIIDVAEGTVSGHSRIDATTPLLGMLWLAIADVRGTATCLPLNGLDCGQLVVDLELRGALSDPNNPASVGQMRADMLASFVWDGSDTGHWAAMSANTTIGGNEGLINSVSQFARCNGALVIC